MAKKPDLVVESVRYGVDGKINLVRAFERRGAMYSDWLLIERAGLVDLLKQGRRVVLGRRKEFMAGTFEAGSPVFLTGSDVIATRKDAQTDILEGAPFF